MQEIKFRGKSVENGEWVYGYLFNDSMIGEAETYIETQDCSWFVNPQTVGQYTGLKDKNGKEIYDGDICESIDGIFLVTWDEEKSAFVMVFQDGERLYLEEMWEDTKIIGNINDTPELIKVNNED